jgi:CRISPR-associated Csx10 family RAMP protein
MSTLQLHLLLLSPTCVGRRPTSPGQIAETQSYLSGTVLRGAVAALLLAGRHFYQLPDEDRQQFKRIFVDEQVHFGNAIPFSHKGRTWIVPGTAWSDKRRGGWSGDKNKPGVTDVLPLLLRNQDTEDLDRVGDEFVLEPRGPRWKGISVRRRLISRTAIADSGGSPTGGRGTAADRLLYSFEALETRQEFSAILDGPDGLIDVLRSRLQRDTVLQIGQGRSRGLGQVQITNIGIVPREVRDAGRLADTAREFSQAVADDHPTHSYLPITLVSDMLLRDNYLIPCTSGELSVTLSRYLSNPSPPSLELCYAIQDTRWVGGWDDFRRLPRAPQLAVTQGSVWVYRIANDDLDQAVAWWLAAEEAGLGERVAEGFGRVRLLHPLHQEVGRIW